MELENRVWFNSNAFNSTLVNTTPNAEKALFTPSWTPTVLDRPEFLSRRFVCTIANQQHSMIGQLKRIEAATQAWNVNIIFVMWISKTNQNFKNINISH